MAVSRSPYENLSDCFPHLSRDDGTITIDEAREAWQTAHDEHLDGQADIIGLILGALERQEDSAESATVPTLDPLSLVRRLWEDLHEQQRDDEALGLAAVQAMLEKTMEYGPRHHS